MPIPSAHKTQMEHRGCFSHFLTFGHLTDQKGIGAVATKITLLDMLFEFLRRLILEPFSAGNAIDPFWVFFSLP